MTKNICRDALEDSNDPKENERNRALAVEKVIANPKLLERLDFDSYCREMQKRTNGNIKILIDQILDELKNPFKDPREPRNINKTHLKPDDIFYMLIDETPATFKKGIIVTATVTNLSNENVFCRLENGLTAKIAKSDILGKNDNSRFEDSSIQPNTVISGRISEVHTISEPNFSVVLKCKAADLEKHNDFIEDKDFLNKIPPEDLICD